MAMGIPEPSAVNLLGSEQHGHIAAVGFDTYLRLLSEEVAQMKGEPLPPEREVRIDLPVKAFIPPEWVGQEGLRLELYRRIATARDRQELETVAAEAEDRFGLLPPPVSCLFAVATLKLACLDAGVEEVSTFRNQVRLRPVQEGLGYEVAATVAEASYHPATKTLNLTPSPTLGGEALARWIEEVLTQRAPSAQEASA
jgi:transcription-repair coupling factor (superfamily II helicase)